MKPEEIVVYMIVDKDTGDIVTGAKGQTVFDNRSGCTRSVSTYGKDKVRVWRFLHSIMPEADAKDLFSEWREDGYKQGRYYYKRGEAKAWEDFIEPRIKQHDKEWKAANKGTILENSYMELKKFTLVES